MTEQLSNSSMDDPGDIRELFKEVDTFLRDELVIAGQREDNKHRIDLIKQFLSKPQAKDFLTNLQDSGLVMCVQFNMWKSSLIRSGRTYLEAGEDKAVCLQELTLADVDDFVLDRYNYYSQAADRNPRNSWQAREDKRQADDWMRLSRIIKEAAILEEQS